MVTVNPAQAKARLSELLDKVEAGQEVVITRRGKAVTHLSAAIAPKRPLPLSELAGFRASMPPVAKSCCGAVARGEGRGLVRSATGSSALF